MNRVFKFRAWHENLEQMFQVTSVSWSNGELFELGLARDGKAFGERDSLACHLMQYTGLKDKNGVEIYEGDLFLTPAFDAACPVEFNAMGHVCLVTKAGQCSLLIPDIERGEVIGNIYETPELLNTEPSTTVSETTKATAE